MENSMMDCPEGANAKIILQEIGGVLNGKCFLASEAARMQTVNMVAMAKTKAKRQGKNHEGFELAELVRLRLEARGCPNTGSSSYLIKKMTLWNNPIYGYIFNCRFAKGDFVPI